jgi:hypothetical protein
VQSGYSVDVFGEKSDHAKGERDNKTAVEPVVAKARIRTVWLATIEVYPTNQCISRALVAPLGAPPCSDRAAIPQ